jgi:hypothetical protein
VGPEADPFPDHQPDDTTCIGFVLEAGLLEVDTAFCPYLNASQPSARRLRRGERLVGGMSHDDLWAEEGAPPMRRWRSAAT